MFICIIVISLQFGQQGGLVLLYQLMKELIDALRNPESLDREREESCVLQLYDSVKCLKAVINTWVCVVCRYYQWHHLH